MVGLFTLSLGSSINYRLGQYTLLAFALLCLAWWSREAGRPVLCGVLAALASFKPTVGVFVYLLLAVERDRKALAALALMGLGLMSWPLIQSGPIELTQTWIDSMRLHSTYPSNQPEWHGSYGLKPLMLANLGIRLPLIPVLVLGVIGFAWSLWRRRFLTRFELFALCSAWPVLFLTGHNYDVIALFPLMTAALLAARHSSALMGALTALILLVGDETGVIQRRLPLLVQLPRLPDLVGLLFLIGLVVAVERRAWLQYRNPGFALDDAR